MRQANNIVRNSISLISNSHSKSISTAPSAQQAYYSGTTKVGSKEEILEAQQKYREKNIEMISFYSSELNMIIDDPSLMTVPIDDRIINRSHGVFESMAIKKFRFLSLQQHLSRLEASSQRAGIEFPMDINKIQQVLVDMASFSYGKLQSQGIPREDLEQITMNMRIWLSSGRKDFGIYSYGKTPILYCCTFINHKLNKDVERLAEGIKEFTIEDVQIQRLDTVKSTSYLHNCVIADISKRQGGYQGLKLDQNGNILEQAMANVAYVNKMTQEFIVVPQDHIISGTTLKKVVENFVKPILISNGMQISQIVTRYFTVDEVIEQGSEFISFGGDKVLPILSINSKSINEGKKGPICQMIQDWYYSLEVAEGDFLVPVNFDSHLNNEMQNKNLEKQDHEESKENIERTQQDKQEEYQDLEKQIKEIKINSSQN